MAKMETLTDSFGGTVVDSSKWATWTLSGGSTPTEGGGTLNETSPVSGSSCGIWSGTTYDLTGSYAYVELSSAGDAASGSSVAGFSVDTTNDPSLLQNGGSTLFKLEFFIQSGSVQFGYYNGNSGWSPTSATYNATSMKFLRFRESGGTVFWETSPDGSTWTTQRSVTDPFSLTAVYATAWCRYGATTETSAWADFNTITVPVTVSDSGTGTDAIAVTIPVSLPDSGTATDSFALTAKTLGVTDSGSGTDALSVPAESFPLADAGTGTDELSLTAVTVPLADSGSGHDSFSNGQVALPASVALLDALADAIVTTDALSGSVALEDALAGAVSIGDSV